MTENLSTLRQQSPVIAHEVGQYPVYPLWNEIDKYTGVLEARNLESLRQQAVKNHIEHQDRKFHEASGALQTILYKGLIENLLRTPSCAGFQMLSMTDYSGQGEALVGWLDSFWDSKGIITPNNSDVIPTTLSLWHVSTNIPGKRTRRSKLKSKWQTTVIQL